MLISELDNPAWFQEDCIMGIDEAGRGPVLGPMVYGAAFCAKSASEYLASLGFHDSKQLTEETRAQLFASLQNDKRLGHVVDSLSAQLISSKMLARARTSLNELANKSTFGLIQTVLDAGVKVSHIYVDTVGTADKYQDVLSARFPGISFTVESKADATYPIVGAASIAAKVTRDTETQGWVFAERFVSSTSCLKKEKNEQEREEDDTPGTTTRSFSRSVPAPTVPFGSGYPSDPVTKTWMASNIDPIFGYPSLVRFSWGTSVRALEHTAVEVTWEGDEEAGESGQQAKLSFGGGKGKPAARHAYFKTRRMLRPVGLFLAK